MKIVFVCDTPLQILNMLQYIEDNNEKDKIEADVFIYHQFRNSNELSDRLKNEKIISNVYDITVFKKYSSWQKKVVTLLRLVFPKRFLYSQIVNKEVKLKKRYDKLVICFPTTLCICLRIIYATAKVELLEDGIGTYISDLSGDYYPPMLKILAKITRSDRYLIKPQSAFVRIPNMMLQSIKYPISKLGTNNCSTKILDRVFEYRSNKIYSTKKFIYLTQPLNEKEGYINFVEEQIYEIIEQYRSECVFRYHPRDTIHNEKLYEKDEINNLWELECIHQINSEHVLIGAFSTAQLMPKLLKGEEPYLIFTYKLFFENAERDKFWKDTGTFIEKFRIFYQDKSKIFVPSTISQLSEILSECI